MAIEVHNLNEPTTTSLMRGIIDDIQRLVRQQLKLMRYEIEEDLRKCADAAVFALGGLFLAVLGVVVDCLAAVYLLHWATSPPDMDPAWLPLWACHAIVGFALLLTGGGLLLASVVKVRSIHPLENPATEELKENVKWVTHPK